MLKIEKQEVSAVKNCPYIKSDGVIFAPSGKKLPAGIAYCPFDGQPCGAPILLSRAEIDKIGHLPYTLFRQLVKRKIIYGYDIPQEPQMFNSTDYLCFKFRKTERELKSVKGTLEAVADNAAANEAADMGLLFKE